MSNQLRLTLCGIAAAALAVLTVSAAGAPVDPVNKDRNGVAIKGYDAVAYFEQKRPERGKAEFQYDWMGAKWRFASAANRDLFAAQPERYAPQFGGYCAWAVGHAYTASADPEAWSVIDGKLYLNYNKDVQKQWLPDAAKWIGEGNKNWPSLHK